MPYAQNTRNVPIDNQEGGRRGTRQDADAQSVSLDVYSAEQLHVTFAIKSAVDDDTHTFLYDQTGTFAEPLPKDEASRRFTNFDEEYRFQWHATEDELTEVYGPKLTQQFMRDRELVQQGIAVFQQTLANAKRDNPEFVANTYKSHVLEAVSSIEDNLKRLNMYREIRDDPAQFNSQRELASTWVAQLLSNIQNYLNAVRGTVDVSGDLMKQQDDGTYVLSNFTLSYDGVEFFEHKH
jgi:hypothetical protein